MWNGALPIRQPLDLSTAESVRAAREYHSGRVLNFRARAARYRDQARTQLRRGDRYAASAQLKLAKKAEDLLRKAEEGVVDMQRRLRSLEGGSDGVEGETALHAQLSSTYAAPAAATVPTASVEPGAVAVSNAVSADELALNDELARLERELDELTAASQPPIHQPIATSTA